jgi:hypothetical protein
MAVKTADMQVSGYVRLCVRGRSIENFRVRIRPEPLRQLDAATAIPYPYRQHHDPCEHEDPNDDHNDDGGAHDEPP